MKYVILALMILIASQQAHAQVISNMKKSSSATTTSPLPQSTGTVAPSATKTPDITPVVASKPEVVLCPAGEITINGIIWAGANVSEWRSFASHPDSIGRFYQFNNTIAYSNSNPLAPEWKIDSTNVSIDWQAAKDPCPYGWRLPIQADLLALVNAGSAWYTGYNVPGRFFGVNAATATRLDNKGCIFLPAAGLRNELSGSWFNQKIYGYYWSAKQNNENSIYLYFSGANSGLSSGSKNFAYPVRCVKK